MQKAAKKVNFSVTTEERILIQKVADKAWKNTPQGNLGGSFYVTKEDHVMDLIAVHKNGCPMDWEKLLRFPPAAFRHDIQGISRNLNRQTGELENFFIPRAARTKEKKS